MHPLLERARVAKTMLCLPHADLQVSGTVTLAGRITLQRARGGQAHLWGSKHAARWAWLHCNDLRDPHGERLADSFIDAVSVYVPRLGRDLGPSTPVLARVDGRDFTSISPRRVLANRSSFRLRRWELQASDGRARLDVSVYAPHDRLVGVTYRDPDGQAAYCYNTEVASLRLGLRERERGGGFSLQRELTAPGVAHFEYAQRQPVAAVRAARSLDGEHAKPARPVQGIRRSREDRAARRASAVQHPPRRMLSGPYASLNLGAIAPVAGERGHGDDAHSVLGNRRLLAEQIGLPAERFAHARQVHGREVLRVTDATGGVGGTERNTRPSRAARRRRPGNGARGCGDGRARRRLPAGRAGRGGRGRDAPRRLARPCGGVLEEGVRSLRGWVSGPCRAP